jgi:hypothetical protein
MEIKKRKPEKEEALLFAKFLGTNIIRPNLREGEFDYTIGNNSVEISEIVDRNQKQVWAGSHKTISYLKEELNFQLKDLKTPGIYYISIPINLKIRSRVTANEYAKEIMGHLKAEEEFKYRGNTFKIHMQETSPENTKKFSIFSIGGGDINPEGVIFKRISTKIEKANKQLSFAPKSHKRILLLCNKYHHTDERALLKVYTHLEPVLVKYHNIDEVWIQFSNQKSPKHILYLSKDPEVHEKKALCNLHNLTRISSQISNCNLKKRIFLFIGETIKNKSLLDLFPKNEDRIEILRFLGRQIDDKGYVKIHSLVREILEDPDPTPLGEEPSDCEFHNQIKQEQEYNIVWTVQGELSSIYIDIIRRATQKNDKETLRKCLQETNKILSTTKNLYVWALWLAPFSALISAAHQLKYPKWLTSSLRDIYKKKDGLLDIAKDNKVLKRILLVTVVNELTFLSGRELNKIFNIYITEVEGYIPFLRLYLHGENWFRNSKNLPKEVQDLKTLFLKERLEGIITGDTSTTDNIREDFYLELWRCFRVTPENKRLIDLIRLLISSEPPNSKEAITLIKNESKILNKKLRRDIISELNI